MKRQLGRSLLFGTLALAIVGSGASSPAPAGTGAKTQNSARDEPVVVRVYSDYV